MSYIRITSRIDIPFMIEDDAFQALPDNLRDHYRLKTEFDDDPIHTMPVSRETQWSRPDHWIGFPEDDILE